MKPGTPDTSTSDMLILDTRLVIRGKKRITLCPDGYAEGYVPQPSVKPKSKKKDKPQ